jgi:hypothetical protein
MYTQHFVHGELEVRSADGKITRIPLRLGYAFTLKRRNLSLLPHSFRNVITVPGNNKGIQEDTNIDDKLRWLWNEGMQVAFKYYE